MATMNTNFAQAAIRHWDSSRRLKEEGRLQDAAYLAGYVGECALKAVMVALDSPSAPKAYGHDLEALSGDALDTAALFTSDMGRYSDIAAPLTTIAWKPEWRYEENVVSPVISRRLLVSPTKSAFRCYSLWRWTASSRRIWHDRF